MYKITTVYKSNIKTQGYISKHYIYIHVKTLKLHAHKNYVK